MSASLVGSEMCIRDRGGRRAIQNLSLAAQERPQTLLLKLWRDRPARCFAQMPNLPTTRAGG
eukprot:12932148-Alexandrium_andersonii.AAC.1